MNFEPSVKFLKIFLPIFLIHCVLKIIFCSETCFGTPIANKGTNTGIMLSIGIKKSQEKSKVQYQKYYKCDRCGYISIVKNSNCPVCKKDGFTIKMK